MTSSYIPESGSGNLCDPPISRAALIALRNGGNLQKDCHYVINDYVNAGTVGAAIILLHATGSSSLSMTALVQTTFDNVAWNGIYDIDTNRIIELRDNVENIVIGEDTVDAFPWGNANVTRNYVSESTLTYVSGGMNRNRIENGATVTVNGTFAFNEIQGTVTVDHQGADFRGNDISGDAAQVFTAGNVVFYGNTVKDESVVNLINGTSDNNVFEGNANYQQVGNGGTVNNSRIHGTSTVTSAVALNLSEIFSTSFNTTGSSGLIQGARFFRSVVTLQNIVNPIDIDDSEFSDTDLNCDAADQVLIRGSTTSGAANIDVGPAAILFLTESTVKNQSILNVNAGRVNMGGSTIDAQGNVTCNSSSIIANSVSDSTIKSAGVLVFDGDANTNTVERCAIENQADVRFQAGAVNSQLLTTTVDETQVLINGTGDIRHSRISGTVVWQLTNMVVTNVTSLVADVNLTDAIGTMANCTFDRANINLTGAQAVTFSNSEVSSSSTVAAQNSLLLTIEESVIEGESVVDVEANTELFLRQSTLSNSALVNVDVGRLVVNFTHVNGNSEIRRNGSAGSNNVTSSRVEGASVLIFSGINCRFDNSTLAGASIANFTATTSDNCDILRTDIKNSGNAVVRGTNALIEDSQILNNATVDIATASVGATIRASEISRYTCNLNGAGDLLECKLFGVATLTNDDMVISQIVASTTGFNLAGSVGTINNSYFDRASITITNTPDVDIDQLNVSGLATLTCSTATRLDLTNVNFDTNSTIDIESNTILDMDDCSIGEASFINVDAGHLRVIRCQMHNGNIANTAPNATANIVVDTTIASESGINFFNTVDDCRVEFSTLAGNTRTNFRGTTVGGRISNLLNVNRRAGLGAVEVQIGDSDNAVIDSCTVMNDSQLEIDNSPGAQIVACKSGNNSRISIRDNTAVVSSIRNTVENNSFINLINTAVAATLADSTYVNSFAVNFDFTAATTRQFQFGSGDTTVTQTDPVNGAPAQNF